MTRLMLASLTLLAVNAGFALGDSLNNYTQTNLTSNLPGLAAHQDANLVNPWGLVAGPTTPFWVADNGSGVSTLYDGTGTAVPLVVNIPAPAGATGNGAPTGIVFNSTSSFGGAHFIFDTENGTVASWSGGTNAMLQADTGAGSVYKGLAIGNNGSSDLLYAANFRAGKVDVFNSTFAATSVSGGFVDPNLPSGYAPFDIQNIGGKLYVTYALQDTDKKDDVAGPGHGFIDVFDQNGNLLNRLVSQGQLNSPWGLAVAPSKFGAFSGDLLVGNFGDGTINAFDPLSGGFLGTLNNPDGTPIVNEGLWALSFGNGAHSQGVDSLFFTAGIPGPGGAVEDNGLFGSISTTTPEPGSVLLVGVGFALLLFGLKHRFAA
jgi:uncharacterized protein (TIGR03118 family)